MNVDSILEQKGTEVATIAPEASIKSAAFPKLVRRQHGYFGHNDWNWQN
jgi:hypothetical protein